MAETLLIRLGSQRLERIHWLISTTDTQEVIASGELADAQALEQLSEKAASRQVVVLVPACDVSLKQLTVPGKSPRAIKLAAPYMLEDDLVQDVEQLFFAYHQVKEDDSDANCFMAVVERSLMHEWLSWLSDADIVCSKMLPDALLLPLINDQKTTIQLGEQILVRENHWQATAVDLTLWPIFSGQWQEEVTLANYSALTIDNEKVTLAPQPEELPLALLANNIQQQRFNLLQGEFKVEDSLAPLIKLWRMPAILVLIVFTLVLTGKGYQLVQLNEQQSELEQQIVKRYKEAFPQAKRVKASTVRSLLRSKLKTTGSQAGQERFISLFNKVAVAFESVKTVAPTSLKFDAKRGEFRLQLTANGYSDFEKFKNSLEKQRLVVSVGSQNNQGNNIVGSFSIKEG